jgi:hypothetical protein
MRRFFVFLLLVLGLGVPAAEARTDLETSAARRAAERLRAETWHWQRLMGHRRTVGPGGHRALPFWRRQAHLARRRAARPPHLRAWLCIHRYEGPWNARTGNGYYGGLQMDLTFQRVYAPRLLRLKGTADRWKPIEQMWVAERAHRSGRGFRPWPNTARMCGVL